MMMKALRHIFIPTAVAMIVAMAAGCVKEQFEAETQNPGVAKDELTFDMSFIIPVDNKGPQTKTMDGTPHVNHLYVAVFGEGDILAQKIVEAEPGRSSQPTNQFIYDEGDHYLTWFHVTLRAASAGKRYVHFIATEQELPELMSARFEDEATFVKRLVVQDGSDAYWGRVELENGIAEGTDQRFQRIPMVRNYLRTTVAYEPSPTDPDKDKFSLISFKVFNVPRFGTVAPYNASKEIEYVYAKDEHGNLLYYDKTGVNIVSAEEHAADPYNSWPKAINTDFNTFADYTVLNGATAYRDLTVTQKYGGYMPGLVPGENMYTASFPESEFLNPGEYDYLYECSHTSSNNNPFIIFKGTFENDPYYYKADFVYDNDGENFFYDLLRNFEYRLTISRVNSKGANTIEEAVGGVAMNNFEASTQSQMLTNISDGQKQLYISITDVLVNKDTQEYTLYLQSYDIATNGTKTLNNSNIGLISIKDGNWVGGQFIKQTDIDMTIPVITDTDNPYCNWKPVKIRFSPNPNNLVAGAVWRQPITFSNKGNDAYGVTRTCTFTIRERMSLTVDAQDYVEGNDASVWVDFSIPAAYTQSRFPLFFDFEFKDGTLCPDASNPDYPQLTVLTRKSRIHGQETQNTYCFRREITWKEYNETWTDAKGIKTFRTYFKTLTASSATVVWVFPAEQNDYYQCYVNQAYTNFDIFLNIRQPGAVHFEEGYLYMNREHTATMPVTTVSGGTITYSSDNPSVADVDPVTGLIHSYRIGTAHITATCAAKGVYGEATDMLTVVVKDGDLPTFDLKWARENVPVVRTGQKVKNVAVDGSGRTVSYSSSNNSMATVDSHGEVTGGNTTGSVIITAEVTDDYGNKQSIQYSILVVGEGAPSGTLYHNEPFDRDCPTKIVENVQHIGDYVENTPVNGTSYSTLWWIYDDNGVAVRGASGTTSDSYLTSVPYDLRCSTKPVLVFEHAGNGYIEDGASTMPSKCTVEIKVGTGAWTVLPIDYPDGGSYTYVTTAVDLTSYIHDSSNAMLSGANEVSIRFHYTSAVSDRGTWEIRKVRIVESAEV